MSSFEQYHKLKYRWPLRHISNDTDKPVINNQCILIKCKRLFLNLTGHIHRFQGTFFNGF